MRWGSSTAVMLRGGKVAGCASGGGGGRLSAGQRTATRLWWHGACVAASRSQGRHVGNHGRRGQLMVLHGGMTAVELLTRAGWIRGQRSGAAVQRRCWNTTLPLPPPPKMSTRILGSGELRVSGRNRRRRHGGAARGYSHAAVCDGAPARLRFELRWLAGGTGSALACMARLHCKVPGRRQVWYLQVCRRHCRRRTWMG